MRLYELAQNYKEIIDLDDEQLQDTLESIEDAIEIKVENCAKLIKIWEAEAEAFKAEADRLAANATTRKNKVTWLKNHVLNALQIANKEKIATSIGVVSKAKTPPKVEVLNEKNIPDKFFRIIPETKEIDKKAILEAYKTGEVIDGAAVTQGYRLSIR